MPLPTEEPTDSDAVKAWLGIDDDVDDDRLSGVVGAVNVFVRGLPVAQASNVDPALTVWPATITQGATMLAARLLRRKNSTEGVAAFGNEGPVYVQRNDPDVAMMLGLGDWAKPAVG